MAAISYGASILLSAIPSIPYPHFESNITAGASAFGFLALYVVIYYWLHYGGTLNHRNKPEWDVVPTIVKEDIFFAKATIDDLEALKLVRKTPLTAVQMKSEKELVVLMPRSDWQTLDNPLHAFKRVAASARIAKPKHIF